MTFSLTDAQLDTLLSFHDTTLALGSLAFDWVDPRDGSAAEFRFLEPPQTVGKIGPDLFKVTIALEELP
jgi:hypothetical protein